MSGIDLLAPLQCASATYPNPDYPIIQIRHDLAEADIALHGAHVTSYRPVGEKEVLYLSPDALYEKGTAIRGGVPICWPWFNAHPDNAEMPAHGFARNRFWELTGASESNEGAVLTFSLPCNEQTKELHPYDFELTYKVAIGRKLELRLMTKNTSLTTMPVGGALHSYLAVHEISRACVEGLASVDYIDTVGSESMQRQQEELLKFDQEIDRIYFNTTAAVSLETGFHRLVVDKGGSDSTVVWNPWIEKAAAMRDLPDDGFRKFVCIEAANARADVRRLCPEGVHVLSQTISIQSP